MKVLDADLSWASKTLRDRSPDSHKGQNGRVLVVGGSRQYFGSPALVALGSARAGADLVYLLVPEYNAPTIASYSPDFIVWGYEGEYLNNCALKMLPNFKVMADVMVIGNGITKQVKVLDTASRILSNWEGPAVVDADAISVEFGKRKTVAKLVYTPHPVEFKRLGGTLPFNDLAQRERQVKSLAGSLSATVLLKGKVDVISDGERVGTNRTGNSAMTCGGTGDVLAGILSTMLAQGHSPFDSACLAAYINGRAGEFAFASLGYSLCASDVVLGIPAALMEIRAKKG